MDKITRTELTSIIMQFYTKQKNTTQQKLADFFEVDHSSISKWIKMTTNISTTKFNNIINYLSNDIKNDPSNIFCNYLISELTKKGYNKSKCETILNKEKDIAERLNDLLENYSTIIPQLQKSLTTSSIVSRLKYLCYQYKDFINIQGQNLGQDNGHFSYEKWIFCSKDTQDPTIVTQQNYLILNFPTKYRVAIILTNYEITDILSFSESVDQLKKNNNIELIIVFTDNDIPYGQQKHLIETHNLFFETITKQDLLYTHIQSINFGDISSANDYLKSQFYAQAIFDRLTSYFNVIRNEIIFRTYNNNHHPSLEPLLDKSDLLKGFVDKILVKDIFNYSYLSRHSIYFERERLKEEVDNLLEKKQKKSLGLAMEICYPNSFLSSAIYKQCDELLLLTSSFYSLELFKNYKKLKNNLFPNNIQFSMSHINPQYIANQFYEKIIGKVDLIILGFGLGSSIVKITEYLRHINSWLSPDGIIFISFANADSIILKKQLDNKKYLETSPLYFSDYWKYSATDSLNFLARIKRYSPEEARRLISTYVNECDCCTYPFLSGLIDTANNNKLLMQVRQIDKDNALKEKNKYGHYISIIGRNNSSSYNDYSSSEQRILRLQELIYSYLNDSEVEYEIIKHAVTIDTPNLFKALLEKGIDNNQFDLIKTVILQKHNSPDLVDYCILPRDHKIKFTETYNKLVSERKIVKIFGRGSISPLMILPSIVSLTNLPGTYSLSGFDSLTKEFVIFSSGISTESIKMRRDAFIKIMQQAENINTNSLTAIQ